LPAKFDDTKCRPATTIASRIGVSMRDLDRALWQWNKEGVPGQPLDIT